MKVADFVKLFEELYSSKLAEDWDNTGLLLGSGQKIVKKVLLCLDVTQKTMNEAVQIGADLMVSHHPLIFKPIKSIVDTDSVQKLLMDLIKNDISVISLHTNLDMAKNGVNDILANEIKLKNIRNLKNCKYEKIFKFVVFVPKDHIDNVRAAICKEGAGHIGSYKDCTFGTEGIGSFTPLEGTNPYIGKTGTLEFVEETRLETVVTDKNLDRVIKAMKAVHPYEEVAYDILPMERNIGYSFGKIGELEKPLNKDNFLKHLKESLKINDLRYSGKKEKINKVAVFSGSFDGNLEILKRNEIDALVTGDVRYHTALDAMHEDMIIADCGHFATEIIVLKELKNVLKDAFSDIEIEISTCEVDPFVFD